jgi:uncharacterized protein YbjT (DUF2867 family)
MDILVAGGHGQVALRLLKLLAADDHTARGLIRKPAQAGDLRAVGAVPVIGDLENDASLAAYVKGADAATAESVSRYVMVSSIGAEDPAAGGAMRPYLEAKAEADAYVVASGLDYTIVRPGHLTDDPGTGLVKVSRTLGNRGPIPRDDVAAVLAACLQSPSTIGVTFELFAGDTPIAEALAF